MSIQSLSIVVPAEHCINQCKFCVACMNDDNKAYKNQMDQNLPFYDLYFNDYIKRLEYARDMGVQAVMLTGNAEPQQNRMFLKDFGLMMMIMNHPFRNIEMQTTGRLLDNNYLRFLRNHVGVNTISLSVSSIFNDRENCAVIDSKSLKSDPFINLEELCAAINKYDFNLRLSLNLNTYMQAAPEELFRRCKDLGAAQVTLRILYSSHNDSSQDLWIQEHQLSETQIAALRNYISRYGKELAILPYGQKQYDVDGMGVVLDDDCMSTETKADMKYYILRPDCKLYSKWDKKSSLVF